MRFLESVHINGWGPHHLQRRRRNILHLLVWSGMLIKRSRTPRQALPFWMLFPCLGGSQPLIASTSGYRELRFTPVLPAHLSSFNGCLSSHYILRFRTYCNISVKPLTPFSHSVCGNLWNLCFHHSYPPHVEAICVRLVLRWSMLNLVLMSLKFLQENLVQNAPNMFRTWWSFRWLVFYLLLDDFPFHLPMKLPW